ncbi:fibronectin type III domain-containing protein [Paenibacillus sp. WQ 127069]|uniref:Fibronectin type III domain-containing protein n=1 Tax=Paenibacillus baimaensis TaxID=2982185 RepID=A0ABT2UI53_9BACL|nr:fibronectin type III domain-containing protein [Paenibacillus sp. WQ 127069]MCU6794329.1 fibronectin type III domain-containing protein [Paenibacillus sp. WQ 127069]
MNVRKENPTWSYSTAKGIAYASKGYGAPYSELNIVRLAPGNRQLQLDWQYEGSCNSDDLVYEVKLTAGEERTEIQTRQIPGDATSILLSDLEHAVDYEVAVRAIKKDSNEQLAESPARKARTGEVPGIVVNYIHPDDYTYDFSGRSPASPSIVKLPDGTLLASHDVFWGLGGQNLSKIFQSTDDGQSWSFLCDLYPCFWGKLFLHRGALYMLGTSTEYGALLIGRSDDGGATWSEPTELIPAGSREEGGPHKAPMPIVEHEGRIWSAVEYGSWSLGGHATGVISAPADADLLDSANWAIAPFLPYNNEWPGVIEGGRPSLLEGNIVIAPGGRLVNLLRYNTGKGNPDYGRAIILNVNTIHPDADLTFGSVIDFHGNMSKFTVHYDPVSGRYWSLVNRVTLPNVSQRNILSLVSSADLESWQVHTDALNYQDNGWMEDDLKVGFQYVDWLFNGDDMIYLSRTALNDAYNFHNANYMTFHTLEKFRAFL